MSDKTLGQIAYTALNESRFPTAPDESRPPNAPDEWAVIWGRLGDLRRADWEKAAEAVADAVHRDLVEKLNERVVQIDELHKKIERLIQERDGVKKQLFDAQIELERWKNVQTQLTNAMLRHPAPKFGVGSWVWYANFRSLICAEVVSINLGKAGVSYKLSNNFQVDEGDCLSREEAAEWVRNGGKK